MVEKNLDTLKSRIFGRKSNVKETELTAILNVAREFGCLGEIFGREFEVKNKEGEIIFKISQKPIKIKQLSLVIKELTILKKIDWEIEVKKHKALWGKKGRR